MTGQARGVLLALALALAAGALPRSLSGQPVDHVRTAGLGREEGTATGSALSSPLLRPIRTNSPGTGVFIGSGVVSRILWDRRSGRGVELDDVTAVLDFRYTPATHWVVGARVPIVLRRELRGPGLGSPSTRGVGDLAVGVKRRFYRTVGRWADRHAAVEVEVEVPLGRSLPGLPSDLDPVLRDLLRPSTGSVDWTVDLVYQEGRRRFVYGGDLLYRRSGEGEEGYRRGPIVRLNFDLEYILYPLEYRRPGNEVFVLLEGALLRHGADDIDGRAVAGTGRSELLLAPGIQHVATEKLLLSGSLQFSVWQNIGSRELERDLNVLAEIRYAF